MANFPQNAFGIPLPFPALAQSQSNYRRSVSIEQLILELSVRDLRENALYELSKKRELSQDLAPLLWRSFGTIPVLLQEIVAIHRFLSPPTLTTAQSNRVCNALALLQCIASHSDTRMPFLRVHFTAKVPISILSQAASDRSFWTEVKDILFFILKRNCNEIALTSPPFEFLRLTSLGVIGALVKVDDTDVIRFLLSTEIIPLCLRSMEMGRELSKTVATFIVQKILMDDIGLEYICATAERFFAVSRVLGSMVAALAEQPAARLLKHIVRCYLRLTDNRSAREALRTCLPDMLRDATFSVCFHEDPTIRRWQYQLLHSIGINRVPQLQAGGGAFDHMMM